MAKETATEEDFTPSEHDEKLLDWLSKGLRSKWRSMDEEEEAAAAEAEPPPEEAPVRRGFASWWTGQK